MVLSIVLALGLVTYGIIMVLAHGQSVWFDEGYTIIVAKSPVHDLLSLTAVDAHPPFYYLLLKVWAGVFGWSEFALRSLSALFAVGTIGVSFLLIRKLFSSRIAIWSVPLLVLSPFLLRYGYEIRMYALVGFIGVLATLFLVYARQRGGKKYWITYAVLVALGMYTLYMSVAIWIAHVVWLAISDLKQKKQKEIFRSPWLRSYILAIVLFVPYMPTFFHQLTHSALPGIGGEITLTQLATMTGFIFFYTPQWQLSGMVSLTIVLVLSLVGYIFAVSYVRAGRDVRRCLLFLAALATVPQLFYAILSIIQQEPMFIMRYMAHTVPFIYIGLASIPAIGWRYGLKKQAMLLGGLLVIVMAIGVTNLYRTGNFNFERMQQPRSAELRHDVHCDDKTVIVADDAYTYIDNAYYFTDCDLRFFSPDPIAMQGGYAPLSTSEKRVDSPTAIRDKTVYVIHWAGQSQLFTPPSDYHLVRTTTYDKQILSLYALNVE